jgi:hypothetical protein
VSHGKEFRRAGKGIKRHGETGSAGRDGLCSALFYCCCCVALPSKKRRFCTSLYPAAASCFAGTAYDPGQYLGAVSGFRRECVCGLVLLRCDTPERAAAARWTATKRRPEQLGLGPSRMRLSISINVYARSNYSNATGLLTARRSNPPCR